MCRVCCVRESIFISIDRDEKIEELVRNIYVCIGLITLFHFEPTCATCFRRICDRQQAAKYSASAVPIASALLGGALGGPLGVLVGLKGAAALTAVVGAGAGWITGSWVSEKRFAILSFFAHFFSCRCRAAV